MEGEGNLRMLGSDVARCVFAIHRGDLDAANGIMRAYELDDFVDAMGTFAVVTLEKFAAARGMRPDAVLARFLESPDLSPVGRDSLRFVAATLNKDRGAARAVRAEQEDPAVFTLSVGAFAKNTFNYWAQTQGDSPDVAWTKFLESEPGA